jgi:hypothetical protein
LGPLRDHLGARLEEGGAGRRSMSDDIAAARRMLPISLATDQGSIERGSFRRTRSLLAIIGSQLATPRR